MNSRKPMSPFFAFVLGALAMLLPGFQPAAFGVTTLSVVIGDNFFSPANLTNSVGDSVKWTWQGANSHSSTGPGLPALWDSGVHGNGFVFTQKFPNAGTFPYHCVVHSFQTGTIVVRAAPTNAPPSPIMLQSFSRPSATSFQFSYSTTPGLSYVIQRSADLLSWTPLATNAAAGTVSTFLDSAATAPSGFFAVRLLPNP